MLTDDITLIISLVSALAAVLGLVVALAALRLSAASVPLSFRLHTLEDDEGRKYSSGWVTGWLVNAGPTCKVQTFRVSDWESSTRVQPGEAPVVAERGVPQTYPVPEQHWNKWKMGLVRHISKDDAFQQGLFYPRSMATGDEARVKVRMPRAVKRVELAVGVPGGVAAPRACKFWVDNPLFDPSVDEN